MNKIIKNTIDLEGGYANDPDDKGKETYKGISRKYHPNWNGWEIIDSYKVLIRRSGMTIGALTLNAVLQEDMKLQSSVADLYKKEYLEPFNSVTDEDIKAELFDTAVNMGVITSKKIFQEALNLLNQNQKLFDDLKVDGNIGRKTIDAYKKVKPAILIKVLNGLQFDRYKNNVEKDPDQEKFFAGWMKRI